MMSKAPRPAYDSTILYRSMFPTADDEDLMSLQRAEEEITEAYAVYDSLLGSSADVVPMTDVDQELKAALTRCFERLGNKKINPSNLRQILIDAVPVCPYCDFGESAELDHVLPRSVWPEFLIHISNLVPICGKCNKNKLNRNFRTTGWSYRHPYFQPDLAEKFLFVESIIRGENISYKFRIDNPAGIDAVTFRAVEETFKTFRLDDRFGKRTTHLISDRAFRLKGLHANMGAAGVREYLISEGSSVAHKRGVNYWEAALFLDLADDRKFCDFGSWS